MVGILLINVQNADIPCVQLAYWGLWKKSALSLSFDFSNAYVKLDLVGIDFELTWQFLDHAVESVTPSVPVKI